MSVKDLLLYGDSERSPALRHELPIAVGDPFLFAEVDGRAYLLTNSLDRVRMAAARADAVLIDYDELGFDQLTASGLPSEQIRLELISRAAAKTGVQAAIVDFDFPLGVAERLHADGIELIVDEPAVQLRRRVKTDAQLAGIRRAQRSADAGIGAAATLLGRCKATDGELTLDGEPLRAEDLRAEIRQACTRAGAPASPDLMVVSVWQGLSHDPGEGPLPVGLPIQIDLWPKDEESGCFTDMTRTFVAAGDPPAEIERQELVVNEVRERILDAVGPGVLGRDLYALACDVFEREGYATRRTTPGDNGFQRSLGHGVGLAVHEPPGLGRSADQPLLAGDVIAVEPGLWDTELGGYRYEDVLLVTEAGCETLTDYPYQMML